MTDHKSQSNDHAELSHDPAKDWYDFEPPNEALDYEPVYATLHFYYNDPDSMRRFRLCNQAEDLKLVLWGLDRWLRCETKYGITDEFMRSVMRTNDTEREVAEDALVAVRKELHRICNDYGIDLTED